MLRRLPDDIVVYIMGKLCDNPTNLLASFNCSVLRPHVLSALLWSVQQRYCIPTATRRDLYALMHSDEMFSPESLRVYSGISGRIVKELFGKNKWLPFSQFWCYIMRQFGGFNEYLPFRVTKRNQQARRDDIRMKGIEFRQKVVNQEITSLGIEVIFIIN